MAEPSSPDPVPPEHGLPGAVRAVGAPPPYDYGHGPSGSGDTDVHLLDYTRVLYKRRWSAVASFSIILAFVTVYTFTATPIYEAKAQILIEKENTNVVAFKEAFEQNQMADDYYQTQYRILQSRTLARRTIESLKLWSHPTLADVGRPLFAVMTNSRGGAESGRLAEPQAADETSAQSRVIDQFLMGLTIAPVRTSRLVDIRFESPDARLATTIVNTLARNYIDETLEFKFLSSKEAADWLGERLSEQRRKVEDTEAALQHYREQNDAVSLEERQNIVVQKLADLNAAVTRAKTERIQKEALYNQVRRLQHDRAAVDSVPAIVSNSFIQQQKAELAELERQQSQLSEKLGPNHPDMRKLATAIQQADVKLQSEIAKVIQSLGNEYQAAVVQEQSLSAALEAQKKDALALNRKGIDYGVLQRDAATNRQIFESLLQRTKETGISGALRTSNIRVVDPAEVPRRPIRPDRLLNEVLAVAGGLLFSIGLAFFFEHIDNRIKSPDELRAYLGLPFLGMVPDAFDHSQLTPLINDGVPASFTEAFRQVRTNVLFSWARSEGRSLVITSAGPGEGKTTVSTNLALALAQTGQRVLLMDADLRKPHVHEVFGEPQSPGLSNVLVGDAKAGDAVRRIAENALSYLSAGEIPPNPAELLGSKRFRLLLEALERHFDWIIIDTPPVMAVTDSSLVANQSHGVLFVVGAEMTSRQTARRAVEQLETAKARFIGSVLNRVDLKHNAYYYAHYYKREYGNSYGSSAHVGTPS